MNETLLLSTAIFVFSLMALGLILTIIEFRSLTGGRRRLGKNSLNRIMRSIQDLLPRYLHEPEMVLAPVRSLSYSKRNERV